MPRVKGRAARIPELPYHRGGALVVLDEQFDRFQLLFSRVHFLPPNRVVWDRTSSASPMSGFTLPNTASYAEEQLLELLKHEYRKNPLALIVRVM